MLKKLMWLFSLIGVLSFTSCGGGGKKDQSSIPTTTESTAESSTLNVTENTAQSSTPTENTVQTSTSKLKKTGQTTSYEQFDDGDYQIGITPSYSRSGDIVTDNVTKLQWQDNEDAKTVYKNWEDAKSYCSSLSLGGYNDWRLPTIKELKNIVDYGKNSPMIDSIFVNVTSNAYWSATTYVSDSSCAWAVDFNVGDDGCSSETGEGYIRCVRGGA